MKVELLFTAFLSGLIYLGACVQTVERVGPQGVQGFVDPYFRPKRVYAVDVNQAWDLTLKALNREGISLELVNREGGLMRTAYENISAWERSQCDIRFSPEPRNKTFLYIRCRYEGRKEVTDQFRDFTHSAPRETMKAEEEMYRKIEPYILPFEQTLAAKQEPVAKGQPQPFPAAVGTPTSVKPEPAAPSTAPVTGEGQPRVDVTLPPRVEPASPQPAVSSPQPPPVVAEAKPEPMAIPPVQETPSPKPEATAPAVPPVVETAKKPGIIEERVNTPLTTIEAANVRLAPSTQSKIITVLGKGEKVERVGETGPWTKIKSPSGDTAWIFTAFLKESPPQEGVSAVKPYASRELSSIPSTPKVKTPTIKAEMTSPPSPPKARDTISRKGVYKPPKMVTKAIVKMRAEPSPTSRVVLVLKKGREVEKIGESGQYTKVRLSWGDTGWVVNRYLKKAR